MNEELFDRKIKELLESAQVEPDAGLWDGIRSGMEKRRRQVRFRRITAYVSSIAAALVAGVFLFTVSDYSDSGSSDLFQDISVVESNAMAVNEEQAYFEDSDAGFGEEVPEVKVVLTPETSLLAEALELQNKDNGYAYVQTTETVADGITADDCTENEDVVSEVKSEAGSVSSEKEAIEDIYQYNDLSYDWNSEPVTVNKNGKSGFSISAHGLMSPSNESGNVDFSSPSFSAGSSGGISEVGIKPISVPEHLFPVTVGIDVAYTFLKNRLGVGIGVNYTFLKSSYDALINNAEQASVQQNLHYIGVPLNFYVNIISYKGLNLYANIGGTLEKGIKATYNIANLENIRYTKESKINGIQWSANVGIGLEYRFLDFLGIYLDPHLTYYFDCKQPYSVRTEQPFQFGLQLGFRFII